jgi:hypothetical protein
MQSLRFAGFDVWVIILAAGAKQTPRFDVVFRLRISNCMSPSSRAKQWFLASSKRMAKALTRVKVLTARHFGRACEKLLVCETGKMYFSAWE